MNVCEILTASADAAGDKEAFFDNTGGHTFAEILGRARATAGSVLGVTQRRRVGLLAPTSSAFVAGYFGILLADKVPVPLNFLLGAEAIAFIARDAGIDTVVADDSFAVLASALEATVLPVAAGDARVDAPRELQSGGDDEATLLYTSGTTGRPKGVVLTHGNLLANAESCISHVGATKDDVLLGILPLFHSFGLTTSMLLPVFLGASAVYVPKFSPSEVFESVARRRATLCFAVASMFRLLIRAGRHGSADFSSLRFAVAGGEALGATLSRRFEELFSVPLLEGYGLTETSPVVAVNLPDRHRPGSVGPMLDWVEPRIVDAADRPLPAGGEGELLLRGKSVAAGYHNRPADTSAAFTPDGWFRSGDLARVDADGFLWITGRKKDLIISAGENVAPAEIESVLAEHPGVYEAAVLGIPDPRRGEVPKAFIVLEGSCEATEAELADFCSRRLPGFKVPAAFAFRDELPHTPTGKVHKLALRQTEGLD